MPHAGAYNINGHIDGPHTSSQNIRIRIAIFFCSQAHEVVCSNMHTFLVAVQKSLENHIRSLKFGIWSVQFFKPALVHMSSYAYWPYPMIKCENYCQQCKNLDFFVQNTCWNFPIFMRTDIFLEKSNYRNEILEGWSCHKHFFV